MRGLSRFPVLFLLRKCNYLRAITLTADRLDTGVCCLTTDATRWEMQTESLSREAIIPTAVRWHRRTSLDSMKKRRPVVTLVDAMHSTQHVQRWRPIVGRLHQDSGQTLLEPFMRVRTTQLATLRATYLSRNTMNRKSRSRSLPIGEDVWPSITISKECTLNHTDSSCWFNRKFGIKFSSEHAARCYESKMYCHVTFWTLSLTKYQRNFEIAFATV
jgi:hypothetical protein